MNAASDSPGVRSVYVASPLGFSEPGRRYLSEVLHPSLRDAGFIVLDPWDDPDGRWNAVLSKNPGPERDRELADLNHTTGAGNARLISSASAVLAVLDGTEIDSGTAAEVGYAAAIGRVVIGLRTDMRLSSDNDQAFVNLQVEYFILSTRGALCRTLEEAISALLDRI